MANYQEMKMQQPEMVECFFAFSNKQFEEGKASVGDKKIYSADKLFNGLYGTNEGLTKFFKDCTRITDQISEKCDPQEVYNYEFVNHECSYVGNDEGAIEIVVSYFGKEKAKEVKRRFAYVEIDNLKE